MDESGEGRVRRLVATAAACAALLSCARLSPEWADAAANSVANLTQSACNGSVAELDQGRDERFLVTSGAGRLIVDYHDAHFRCEQSVQARASVSGTSIDIIVQPADMTPASVAKCDCLYDIHFEVPNLPADTYEVSLRRRWDERHGTAEPLLIGTTRVIVP
jgi:hypothetical protein